MVMNVAGWRRWIGFAVVAVSACSRETVVDSPARIELTRGIALRGSGDTVDLTGSPPAIASNGAFFVSRVAAIHGTMATYDASGRLVRVFGRLGSGPGEVGGSRGLSMISGAGIGRGDSIYVADNGNGRMSVYSPPPGAEFVRSFPVGRSVMGVVPTADGLLAGPAVVSPVLLSDGKQTRTGIRPPMVGLPPRLLSWDAVPVAEFGPRFAQSQAREGMGAFAPADSGRIWYANGVRYEIKLVGRDGKTVRTLARNVSWFPVDTSNGGFPWVTPPPTSIRAMSQDREGLLWVLIDRANKDWAKHRPPSPPIMRPGMPVSMMPTIRLDEIWECVLEVLDPVTGALIASTELGGDVRRFVAPRTLYQQAEDSTGLITLQIWKAALKRGQ